MFMWVRVCVYVRVGYFNRDGSYRLLLRKMSRYIVICLKFQQICGSCSGTMRIPENSRTQIQARSPGFQLWYCYQLWNNPVRQIFFVLKTTFIFLLHTNGTCMLYRIHVNRRKKIKITYNPPTQMERHYYHLGVSFQRILLFTYISDFTHEDGFRLFHVTCFLYIVALFHVPLNVLPLTFLVTPLMVHCPFFVDIEVVSNFSLLNSTAVNLCD